jgi:hypothetical protein
MSADLTRNFGGVAVFNCTNDVHLEKAPFVMLAQRPKIYRYNMRAVVLRGGSPEGAERRFVQLTLCAANFMAYRASLGVLARSSGSSFLPGLSLPTDGHAE